MGTKISPELIVADLQRVSQIIGRPPTTTEYDQHGAYSTITIRKNFGTWADCIRAAGMEPAVANRHFYSDAEIYAEMQRLETLLGRQPQYSEIKRMSHISPSTIERRIGTANPGISTPTINRDWDVANIDIADGNWVAGIVDGEGSFSVSQKGSLRFGIGLRADDGETLETVRLIMGLPNPIATFVNSKRRSDGQHVGDEARLHTASIETIKYRVIPFFDRFQLRSKKRLDYLLFKEALMIVGKRGPRQRKWLTDSERLRLQAIALQIQKLHSYTNAT